jgi:hypothetical protein
MGKIFFQAIVVAYLLAAVAFLMITSQVTWPLR